MDLDDLEQEVFLRALASTSPWPAATEGEAATMAYLQRIARHTVIDVARAIRAVKRDGRTTGLDRSQWSRAEGLTPASPGPGPHTAVAQRESEHRLEQAFQRLSGEHRRVIGLRQFEGRSAKETGLRMGRSDTAIHSLYRRALEAWHQAVEGPGA